MKELQEFTKKHTNIEIVTDTGWRYEDITDLELDLHFNPYSWWAYQNIKNYPDFEWPEHWYVASEERFIHPIVAMDTMMEELREVSRALEDIYFKIGALSLYLDKNVYLKIENPELLKED